MLKNRNIPFGYCMINGEFAVKENEAEAVRKIFSDYIGGKSLKTIASEMKIPYNTDKAIWNKNMVCRVLENRKYIGESGYPKIIQEHDFEEAARVKAERNTYRKPAPQDSEKPSKELEIAVTKYIPTEEILRMTNEINRQLETENIDKKALEELIIKCAQLKYDAICEVRK